MSVARCIYREEHGTTHVEVWDEAGRRSLWFDDVILQSEIDLHNPGILPNPVNRAMLVHLMFDRPQRQVLLAGCGGGAIARWFNARSPATRGIAVELSATVARLAHEYFDFPAPGGSWRLEVADVRDYLAEDEDSYDFILVDLEQDQHSPDWLTGGDFLASCRARLSAEGCLLVNLILDGTGKISEALFRIRQVFGDETLLVHLADHDNLLVLAFNDSMPAMPHPGLLQSNGARWGLDFVSMIPQITRVAPGTAPN